MQCLEVSGAVRPLYGSLGVKGLNFAIKLPRGTKAIQYRLHRGSNDEGYMSHKHGAESLPLFPNIYYLLTL
jgi:hypothetical protein